MQKLTGKRNLWFAISLAMIIPGVISLILFGLRLGIDFTGGTLIELQFASSASTEDIKEVLAEAGYDNAIVQTTGGSDDNSILIRTAEVQQGSPEKEVLYTAITSSIGEFEEREFETIGSSVGNQIRDRSIVAVILASIGVLAYIGYAFRNTHRPLLYGICAIVAMLHDLVIVIGLFSILGKVANIEVDALFVTAILTVIGFSIHDKIVVFDRIRENIGRGASASFEDTVNYSIVQTVVRSINNSMTVIFTLLALYLFGGSSTQVFVLVLLIGMVLGTYSSIFTAAQLLVSWESGDIQRLFGRVRGRGVTPEVAPSR